MRHDTDRPRRSAGILECEVLDELLVYLPGAEVAVALNASARAVWELCQGDASLAVIADTLGQRFRLPGEALLPDVHEAVARLRDLNLLTSPD